jgi:hypothetical protein
LGLAAKVWKLHIAHIPGLWGVICRCVLAAARALVLVLAAISRLSRPAAPTASSLHVPLLTPVASPALVALAAPALVALAAPALVALARADRGLRVRRGAAGLLFQLISLACGKQRQTARD